MFANMKRCQEQEPKNRQHVSHWNFIGVVDIPADKEKTASYIIVSYAVYFRE